MKNEIKVNKANKSITFINNGIAFSQFGIADEILDLITNLEQELVKEKATKKEVIEYCKDENNFIVLTRFDVDESVDYIAKDLLNILTGGDEE